MQKHFKLWASKIMSDNNFDKNKFVIELGSNDGIFIDNLREQNIKHLGIEPSKNVAEVAIKKKNKVLIEFFSSQLADKIVREYGKCDYFISANVMCHIPNIVDIANGISKCLKDKGILSFEDPYLGDVLKKITYDQIYDEHVFLFSAHSIKKFISKS